MALPALLLVTFSFAGPSELTKKSNRSVQSTSSIDDIKNEMDLSSTSDNDNLNLDNLSSEDETNSQDVIDQFQKILGLTSNDKTYFEKSSAGDESAFCKEFQRDENTHKFTPSVFHTPIGKTGGKCDLKDSEGKTLVKINCDLKKNCLMQGVCILDHKNGKRIGYNFIKFKTHTNKFRTKSGKLVINTVRQSIFAAFDNARCPFGYGVWSKEHQTSICMDPFRSVAADTKFHAAGDVLFFPALKGLVLPDQSVHNGFMTVRSSGGRIIGAHRFDFYTGICKKSHNKRLLCDDYGPKFFAEIGLAEYSKRKDKSCFYSYYKINDELKKFVLTQRNFPNLPESLVENSVDETWAKFISSNTSEKVLIAGPNLDQDLNSKLSTKSNEDLFF